MARWLLAQVAYQVLRKDRRLREWYKNINADDLDALVAYLRTLKPATP